MTYNPFLGARLPSRSTRSGFAVHVMNPDASRGQPNAEILYFPPVQWGDLENRRRAEIGLLYAESPQPHLPFYFEHTSEPVPSSSAPHEVIRLYVGRHVEIRFPQGTQHLHGALYRIDFPVQHYSARQWVHVQVHRNQDRASIPQSEVDVAGLISPPVSLTGPLVSLSLESGPGQPTQRHRETWPFCTYRTTADGGTQMILGHKIRRVTATPIGSGTVSSQRVITAVVSLRYWNIHLRGAYHVRAGHRRGKRSMLVTITLDRNTYVDMGVVGSNGDIIGRLLRRDQTERSRVAFNDAGIDLRFATVDHARVPEPGQERRTEGQPWYEYNELGRRLRLYPMRDEDAASQFAAVDLGIGFIPIIGEIYNVGQLAYAIATGEDFSGRPVDSIDLIFLGIAVLPVVPSALRRLPDFASRSRAAERILEGSGLGLDGVRRAVRAQRPLLHTVGQIDSLENAFQASRQVLSHGRVRDPWLARSVRREPQRR